MNLQGFLKLKINFSIKAKIPRKEKQMCVSILVLK